MAGRAKWHVTLADATAFIKAAYERRSVSQ